MKKQCKQKSKKWDKLGMKIIAITIAIITSVFLISGVDFEAATQDDWNYLHEHLSALEIQGMEAFQDMDDVKLTLANETLVLESQECSLALKIDKEQGRFIEIKKNDKAFLGSKIILPIMMTIFMGALIGRVFWEMEVAFVQTKEWYSQKNRKSKNKRKP